MTAAIVTPQSFRDYMRSGEFRQSLTESMARNVDPDRLMRVAVSCISKDSNLQKASLLSLAQCVADAARIGLEPGISVLGHCWMVAYQTKTHTRCNHNRGEFNCEVSGSEAQLQVGYRGKAELFRRAVPGGRIHAREWRQRDIFKPIGGTSPRLIHKWNPNENRGGVVGYYAIAFYPDGFRMFDTMTVGEVEEVRQKFSKSKDSPAWLKSFDEMGKAKVTNRLEKWLDLSIEQVAAHDLDDESSVIVAGRKVEEEDVREPRGGEPGADPYLRPGATKAESEQALAQLSESAPGQQPTKPAPPAPPAPAEQPKGKAKSKALEAAQARGGVKASENPPAAKQAAKPQQDEDPGPCAVVGCRLADGHPGDCALTAGEAAQAIGLRPAQPDLPPGVAAIREQDAARASAVWPYTLPEGLMPSERAAWLAGNAPAPYPQCGQTGGCVRKSGHPAAECSSKIAAAGT